jgi:hypothetical protein
MNWLSSIGEAAKTVRVIWQDVVFLVKGIIKRANIEKDIDSNSDLVDGLRKPHTPEGDEDHSK